MKVLVACEFSGRVRDAFITKGHDAISCDILPTESPGPHYQDDIFNHLNEGWDLMIAHPPCTYLSNAGIGYFNEDKWGDKARLRKHKRFEALQFVEALYYCSIPRIAIENPVGYLNRNFRPLDQIIQPYYFGEPFSKRTCLWLKNLPLLTYSKDYIKPLPEHYTLRKDGSRKARYFTDGKTRDPHIRSITFQGIANAMAEQWGSL